MHISYSTGFEADAYDMLSRDGCSFGGVNAKDAVAKMNDLIRGAGFTKVRFEWADGLDRVRVLWQPEESKK